MDAERTIDFLFLVDLNEILSTTEGADGVGDTKTRTAAFGLDSSSNEEANKVTMEEESTTTSSSSSSLSEDETAGGSSRTVEADSDEYDHDEYLENNDVVDLDEQKQDHHHQQQRSEESLSEDSSSSIENPENDNKQKEDFTAKALTVEILKGIFRQTKNDLKRIFDLLSPMFASFVKVSDTAWRQVKAIFKSFQKHYNDRNKANDAATSDDNTKEAVA